MLASVHDFISLMMIKLIKIVTIIFVIIIMMMMRKMLLITIIVVCLPVLFHRFLKVNVLPGNLPKFR